MTKYLFILLLSTPVSTLFCQDTLLIEEVDEWPQILKTDDTEDYAGQQNAQKRILEQIYRNLRVPAFIRETGMESIVKITCLFDTSGSLHVETVGFLPKSDSEEMLKSAYSRIQVTAYPPSHGRNRRLVPFMKADKIYGMWMTAKAEVKWLHTCTGVFETFPAFRPARNNDQQVAARAVFYFDLEIE